ncbi:hypothetical protein GGI07_001070 [Coemansia sp. Benny D115]|nr:hypothetical protein GGI07_001070 [Coemansia sp. Benny D115]
MRDDPVRLRRLLREQLDLEMYLKQTEINTIAERLQHSQALLAVLESAITSSHANSEPADSADGYKTLLRQQLIARTEAQQSSASPLRDRPRRSAARSMTDSSGALYAQRASDDATVCMVCPSCQRREFSSLLGFLNHCRVLHGVEFSGTEEAIQMCGMPMDEAPGEPSSAVSSGRTQPRRRAAVLAGTLSSEQMASVTDALEYLNTRLEDDDAYSGSASDGSDRSEPAGGYSTPNAVPVTRDSRFHVVRRILLGNTSRFVPRDQRPPGQETSTHQWTVYMRPLDPTQPLARYVRKVRMFLHPSYRPDDIVDLHPPSVELRRWGWGEFPIRVQVFFRDRRNKPVDLIHLLKLDHTHSGRDVLGAEMPIDFELDRRGVDLVDSADDDTCDNPLLLRLVAEVCRVYPLLLDNALPYACPQLRSSDDAIQLVPSAVVSRWSWAVAVSHDVWHREWPLGKRLAAEASRNRHILKTLAASVPAKQQPDSNARTAHTLEDTVSKILRAAGAATENIDAVQRLARSSDTDTLAETMEALQTWATEHRTSRPFKPDASRCISTSAKPAVLPLKQWLRTNGFVSVPVLTPSERRVYLGESTDPSADSMDGIFPAETHPKPRPPKSVSYFCNTCGILASRKADAAETLFCSTECERVGHAAHSTMTGVSGALVDLPQGWDSQESDTDELLMVDDDAAAYSAAPSPKKKESDDIGRIASTLRSYHLEQQDERSSASDAEDVVEDAVDDRQIDWVWSVIRPLELNCAPASRFASTTMNDGVVQLPTYSDEAFSEALDQRLVVGRLLLDVAKMFMRDLVQASNGAMRRNRVSMETKPEGRQLMMLTPAHVLAAVKNDPETFDVCSNAYLADD